jgi:hypothetical protein
MELFGYQEISTPFAIQKHDKIQAIMIITVTGDGMIQTLI